MCESESTGLSESHERAVRAELNRLLESDTFRASKRCKEFLAHIVEHTIMGPSGALKERAIGVDLFQLPHDFDTGQRAIVRVTASEVRKKLAQHYLAENGTYHPVRIELPPGSYAAEFKWRTPAAAETQASSPRNRRPKYWVIAGAAAVLVVGAVLFIWRGQAVKLTSVSATPAPATTPIAAVAPTVGDFRMMVGSADSYTDRNGRTWGPDRFFTGGSMVVRPSERIFRTLDPDIYRHLRQGEFRYDIPLQTGSYELHLYFAETGLADFISAESSGEGQRVFRVSANGKLILDFFDVVADAAGSNTSDERVFRDASPADDGYLHLSFTSIRGSPMLSGIEVLPMNKDKVSPVRIRAGWTSSWQDTSGERWLTDSYFLGGNALVRNRNPAWESDSPDMALYASERWGHFSYAVPVADGQYRVKLKFCEGHYGRRNTGIGGRGSRAFDVYCNGVALLRDFDIFKEAGGEGRPVERTFSGVQPTAQGKIVLTFVPVKGMACVNGIEVVEE